MEIRKFEKFENRIEPVIVDPVYNLMKIDNNGDSEEIDVNVNPFDLDEIVNCYLGMKGYDNNMWIKKVTEEIVDLNTIPEINIHLTAKKYNV